MSVPSFPAAIEARTNSMTKRSIMSTTERMLSSFSIKYYVTYYVGDMYTIAYRDYHYNTKLWTT